jgi:metal-responsive CopG/Arc/MetJ family transcriptional regulator
MAGIGSTTDVNNTFSEMQKQEQDFQIKSLEFSTFQDGNKAAMSAVQGKSSTVDTMCQTLRQGAHIS